MRNLEIYIHSTFVSRCNYNALIPASSDSGMSVSFQSGSAGSAGTVSQESSPQQLVVKTGTVHTHGLPNPRPRKLSAGQQSTNL